MDTAEDVNRPVEIMKGLENIQSGSWREGFRIPTSDIDMMHWSSYHKVICENFQINLYRSPKHTLILMECNDLPPGFSKLILIGQAKDEILGNSCIIINNEVYISSCLFREYTLRSLHNISFTPSLRNVSHGPCFTYVIAQHKEIDNVLCLRSHHWPTDALPWMQRCHQQGWPVENVLSEILRGGFHVVPIGSTPENEEEWRISFSRAEQKLVYSMDHCQFLCYGLFKIFLKEVINSQCNTQVLSSYYIKTVVFWVIQTKRSLAWTPENLLACFWECFKLLIYFVHNGECPNFFIPQNNMFRLKITGSVQASLFRQLCYLYYEGISCLLFSPTLRRFLSIPIVNRTLSVCTNEVRFISSAELDMSFVRELPVFQHKLSCYKKILVCMKHIERVIRGRLTPYQTVTLQCLTSDILRKTAMFIENSIHPTGALTQNKVYYKANKESQFLKLSCKFGYVSDTLYLAMYFYRTWRYEQSFKCLKKVQKKMSLPFVIHYNHVDVDAYRQHMVGKSLCYKFRRASIKNIDFFNEYTYIDELVLEQKISEKNGVFTLLIPPLVMLHTLFILNHHRLGDTVRSHQSIQDLQTLLLQDDGVYIETMLRDISWQILGICQQIGGDLEGARESFLNSLKEIPLHQIQEATKLRMSTRTYGENFTC
ncbi:uncharacterized protein LOC134253853 [Saccostrea cucullata]|uniref:uncharacterized protein LOC134253853 n=1 Tax=Saccostrea cuccullata TaxID=36930 RepID=UPI002ED2D7C8